MKQSTKVSIVKIIIYISLAIIALVLIGVLMSVLLKYVPMDNDTIFIAIAFSNGYLMYQILKIQQLLEEKK